MTSVDFPTPAQATIVTMLIFVFAHARSRKAISSSLPNISLPVTGNLAMEIFFGAGFAKLDSTRVAGAIARLLFSELTSVLETMEFDDASNRDLSDRVLPLQ